MSKQGIIVLVLIVAAYIVLAVYLGKAQKASSR